MHRRTVLGLLGGAAFAPRVARAQPQALPAIGMLNSGTSEPRRDQIESFLGGLTEAGFVVGQNVTILKRGAR